MEKKDNAITSLFKEAAAEIASYSVPHSIIRGISVGVGFATSWAYFIQQPQAYKPEGIIEQVASAALPYIAAPCIAYAIYRSSSPAEKLKKLQKKAEPEKWFRNACNTLSEYTETGITAAGALLAMTTLAIDNSSIDLSKNTLSMMSGISMFAYNLPLITTKGIKSAFGFSSDYVIDKKKHDLTTKIVEKKLAANNI